MVILRNTMTKIIKYHVKRMKVDEWNSKIFNATCLMFTIKFQVKSNIVLLMAKICYS